MNISKSSLTLIGVGLVGGVILAWVLFSVLGAWPNEVSVGPIKFGIPTPPTNASQAASQPPAPASEPIAPVSKGKYPCPLLVKQSEVEAWKIGQTNVSAVRDAIAQFDAKRPSNEGQFVKGTKVPSGVLVATNFDEQDAGKWTQYPVTPIIHSGSWGLFLTTGEYTAPNTGACMTVVP